MAVARLTGMFTLQFAEASSTFNIVLIVIIFFDLSICRRLSLGFGGKVVSVTADALIIISWRRGGIFF